MVKLQDACEILSLAEKHGIIVFLDGGWGVDALIGRETRAQNDRIGYEGDLFPQAVFSGRGVIGNIAVNCIEPQSQVMFHLGYEHDENDVHDVMLLCDTFGIPVPEEYR